MLLDNDRGFTRPKGRDGGLTLTLLFYQPRVICDVSQQLPIDPRNLDRLYELVPTLEDEIVFGRARDTGTVQVAVRLPKRFEGITPFPESSYIVYVSHYRITVPGIGGIAATIRLNSLPTITTSWYDIYCTIVAIGAMCVDRYNTGGYAQISQTLQSVG